jgi:hypothetical protein
MEGLMTEEEWLHRFVEDMRACEPPPHTPEHADWQVKMDGVIALYLTMPDAIKH